MLQKNGFCSRLYTALCLITEGGIYLDSDVMLYGDLSTLFDADFVSAVEYHPTVNDKKTNLDLTRNILDNVKAHTEENNENKSFFWALQNDCILKLRQHLNQKYMHILFVE